MKAARTESAKETMPALARAQTEAKNTQSGFSVVELLIALAIMSLLATSLLTIISSGGEAFRSIFDVKDAQGEARVALSYITVKIRQNNALGRISVVPSDSVTNTGNVLKIAGDPDNAVGENYFIYYEESPDGGAGRLVEKYSSMPGVDEPKNAVKIADISGFDISYTDEAHTAIKISVSCDAPPSSLPISPPSQSMSTISPPSPSSPSPMSSSASSKSTGDTSSRITRSVIISLLRP